MVSYVFLIVFGDQVTWNVKPNNTGVFSQQSWESHVFFIKWVYYINTMIYISMVWSSSLDSQKIWASSWDRVLENCKPL